MNGPTSTDDPHFANLLDDLLEQILNGEEPDGAAAAAKHPEAAHRLDEALALASSVAGRKIVARPALAGYEIVRELGRGGMGTVYLARQTSLAREVALKVLPHSFGLSVASRQRFLAEARALAHVKHEHIVDIHRIVDDGDLLAFEMEFVDGPSLLQLLESLRAHRERSQQAASLTQVAELVGVPVAQLGARNLTQFFVRLLLKIARALAAVHAAGFVHRDVKPANLLLRRNGEPVVVDFGLVRLLGIEATHVGSFAGTPVYSSPEQLRGETLIGPASDVYSLAVTLYECLTLATPFAGRTTTELLQRIEAGRFAPLRQLAPDAPRDLETIIAHAMEVDPQRRYRDAGAFADDLQRLLELQPIQARPVHLVRRVGKFLRRNRKTMLAACVGATLVAASLVPILHQVEAAGRAHETARECVRAARQRLISLAGDRPDWHRAGWTNQLSAPLRPTTAMKPPLRQALLDYDRALGLVPADETARRERDVAQLVIWLQQLTVLQADTVGKALQGTEFIGMTAHLGPLTKLAARSMAGADNRSDLTPAAIAEADEDDRKSLGLLAFLLGDFALCQQAWGTLQPDLADQPLIDAGLGRLLLADGMPEAAYVRLLQAQRDFPASATLALELADAALQLGDLGLARRWLDRLPDTGEPMLGKLRIELDLRAASARGGDLGQEYGALAALDPEDPTPRHRLAQLAMRRGDLAEAAHRLDDLVADFPEVARFRLDRARIALQRRNLPDYASEVFAVLDQDCGRNRSHGTTADLLEILRIGGLERLYLAGLAATGKTLSGRAFLGNEVPIQGFAPTRLTERFEDLVRYVDSIRRQTAAIRGAAHETTDLAAFGLIALPLALAQLPEVPLTPPQRLLLGALAWGGPSTSAMTQLACHTLITLWRGERAPMQFSETARPPDLPSAAAFGLTLVDVDDVTGDGIRDLLVACPVHHPQEGRGRVLLVDGQTAATLDTMTGDSDQHLFGLSLATVADLDGDGHPDWLIGSPSGEQDQRRGRAELWSGRTHRRLAQLEGEGPGFGASVAGLGDCDGDGCADFAVATAPLLRNRAAQGSVQIFSGRTRAVLQTLRNDVAGVWFGACIANAGDADGDGTDDLVVGGNYGAAPGLVCLFSGRTGARLQTWTDAAQRSGFGILVRGIGDVDGDGHADVAVAAIRQTEHAGLDQVFLYSGHNGRQIVVLSGKQSGDGFGTAVIPFANQLGRSTLAIGVPFGGETGAGCIEFWTAAGHEEGALGGPGAPSGFGGAIAIGMDGDGDGLPDLFVASPHVGPDARLVRVASRQVVPCKPWR